MMERVALSAGRCGSECVEYSDNDCYSLAGATYGIYSNKDCIDLVTSLTTDKNGNTDIVEIQAGTYYVKETEAPKGFNLSTARNNHCGRTDSSNGLLIRGGLHADETQF